MFFHVTAQVPRVCGDMENVAATLESSVYREKAIKALVELPPFSPILNRLLADLGRDDVSFSRLSDLIEKDTVIAGNILRVVNSALYGRRGTINSVRSAVSVLGLNKLRNFVLGMSVSRMWTQSALPPSFSTARFNQHNVATAILADLLAQYRPVHYPEGAFVAGLFHDLGKMLIAIGMRQEAEEIHKLYSGGKNRMIECEEAILGLNHADLSAAAVVSWNLPEPIQNAVLHHHRPALAAPNDTIPLSRAVAAADHYVNNNGRSIDPQISQLDLECVDTIESFGLGDKTEVVLKQFESEFEAISGFFR
jgi:HD-like signal output (HDOD) protein